MYTAVFLFVVAVSDLNVVILPLNRPVKSRQFSSVKRPVQQKGYQLGRVTNISTASISGTSYTRRIQKWTRYQHAHVWLAACSMLDISQPQVTTPNSQYGTNQKQNTSYTCSIPKHYDQYINTKATFVVL